MHSKNFTIWPVLLNNSSIEMRHIIGPKKPGGGLLSQEVKASCVKALEKEQQLLLRTFLQTALSIHMPQKVCSWSIFMICFLNKGKNKKLSKSTILHLRIWITMMVRWALTYPPGFFRGGDETLCYSNAFMSCKTITKRWLYRQISRTHSHSTSHVIGQHL